MTSGGVGGQDASPPAGRVGQAVSTVLVTGAAGQWRQPPGGVAPGHRVSGREMVPVQVQPAGLNPEAVEPDPRPSQGRDDDGDLAG